MLLPDPARDSPVAGLCRPAGRNAALYAAMGFFPVQQPPDVFMSAQKRAQSANTSRRTFLQRSHPYACTACICHEYFPNSTEEEERLIGVAALMIRSHVSRLRMMFRGAAFKALSPPL